jgi:hypothetical protein
VNRRAAGRVKAAASSSQPGEIGAAIRACLRRGDSLEEVERGLIDAAVELDAEQRAALWLLA